MSHIKRTREEEEAQLMRDVRQRLVEAQPLLTQLPPEILGLIVREIIYSDRLVSNERNALVAMRRVNTTLRDITIDVIRAEYGILMYSLATTLTKMDWRHRNVATIVAYASILASIDTLDAKIGLTKRTKARLCLFGTSTLPSAVLNRVLSEGDSSSSDHTRLRRDIFDARVSKLAGDARDPTFAQIAAALDESWLPLVSYERSCPSERILHRLYGLWVDADWGKNAAFVTELLYFPGGVLYYFVRYVLAHNLGVPEFTLHSTLAAVLMNFWFQPRDQVVRRVLRLPQEVAVPTLLRDALLAYDVHVLAPVEARPEFDSSVSSIRDNIAHILAHLQGE